MNGSLTAQAILMMQHNGTTMPLWLSVPLILICSVALIVVGCNLARDYWRNRK
jgi:hypothetical protein